MNVAVWVERHGRRPDDRALRRLHLGGAAAKDRLVAQGGEEVSVQHDAYVFAHLPITLGLAAAGVGIEHFVVHPVGELSAASQWLFYGGVATYLLGTTALLIATTRDRRAGWPWPGAAVPVILLLGVFTFIPPMLSTAAVTGLVVATVVAGVRKQRQGELDTTEA